MVIRKDYLRKIRPFYHQDLIKVIIGIRRCGKSILLKQIIEEIKQEGIDDKHIIYINFEDLEYHELRNLLEFNQYIKDKIKDDDKYYLFFDEIQNIIGWEKVINSFKATLNVSIFLTGSNSKLLSGELATHIAGRYVSFILQPFSFKEVCTLKEINNFEQAKKEFMDYLKWGGFPQRFQVGGEEQITTYLNDIYNSIVLNDIINRYKPSNVDLLKDITYYLVSTPSQLFSDSSISKYLEKDNRKQNIETIRNYCDYITSSMIVNRVERYDIRGKAIISRQDKYYVQDLGLAHIKNLNKKIEFGPYLENIVYNELIKRGYTVYVGKNDTKEVDFIATKPNIKEYYQVAYILADETVVEREFGAFSMIDDNYPKYVLSLDEYDFSQNGYIHKNIIDWLLEE